MPKIKRFGFYTFLTSSVLALSLGACKKGAEGSAPSPSASASPASNVENIQAWLADDTKPMTAEIYEQLVLSLQKCDLTDYGVDSKCEEYKQFQKARNRNTALKDMAGMYTSIGAKLISHENATVRYQAASTMGSFFGASNDSEKVVLAAVEKEQNDIVTTKLVNVVGSRHKNSPEVKALLLKMADHQNPKVRKEAMGWFLTSFGAEVAGTFEKVLDKVDNDPSLDVRKHLCSRLYGSGDERAIPVFKKYLEGKDTPKELIEGCFGGVISAWTGFPFPSKPNKQAYELTLAFLKQKPRTKDAPPWQNISTLRAAKTEFKDNDSFGKAWQANVKDWYKKPALLAALEEIVHDTDANWMTRTGAVSVLNELSVGKPKLEAMLKKYADAKAVQGDNYHVKNSIERALQDVK